jgi:hypothetical protein
MATKRAVIPLVINREYLSAITTLQIRVYPRPTRLQNELALMPNIDYAFVYVNWTDSFDCGLDALPNLRSLEILHPRMNRKLLGEIAKLRHLERLQLVESMWNEPDLDALCDMFAALPLLRFLSVDSEELCDMIRSSETLRRAMRNITHIAAISSSPSDPTTILADFIETFSSLENVNHITVYINRFHYDDADTAAVTASLDAGRAKARKLRSARLRIDIM